MSLPQTKTAILTTKTSEGEERAYVPVRDRRSKNWHWKLNALHDEIFIEEHQEVLSFAALLGASACAVYDYFCRRADEETQTCFPSNPTIAFGTGLSEPTVREAVTTLCFYGLVWKSNREADEGDPTSNLYFLLPVESWTLDGEKWEIDEKLAEKLASRRKSLRTRKVPYYLRKRFFPGPKQSVEVVKNFDHPGKETLPPPDKNLGEGGKTTLPLLEEASIERESIEAASTEARSGAIAVADDFVKSDLAPAALTPAQLSVDEQLSDFVAARGLSLGDDDAYSLLQNWPAANLADHELTGALVTDYARYSLDQPVDGALAAKMLRSDPARLRWFLCVWHAFKESTDEYQAQTGGKWSKTRCFLNKWQKEQPPATWLEAEVRAVREKIRDAQFKAEQIEVEAFWNTLSVKQKRALDADALADLREKQPGEHFDLHSPELRTWRWRMLRDPETIEWLLGLESGAAQMERDGEAVEGEIVLDDYQESGSDFPPVQLRFGSMIAAILKDISQGKAARSDLDVLRPSLLEDDEWHEVKREITLRLAA